MSFLTEMERVIASHGKRGLEVVDFYYFMDIELLREERGNVYSEAYGKNSGKNGQKYKDIRGLLTSDDFFTSTGTYSGNFVEGFLYTHDKEVKVGDNLRILSEDGKQRNYRVESKESIGMTLEIFTRWKVSNLGD